jgi:hypothetical protein
MSTAWVHPLTRAASVLLARLRRMERTMPTDEGALEAWERWPDYVQTCDTAARLIQLTRGMTWGGVEEAPPRRPPMRGSSRA